MCKVLATQHMTNYLTTIEGRLKQHEQELQNDSNIDNKMVATLLREYEQKAYTDMSHWDVCQLARHPDRPHTQASPPNLT